MGKRVCIVFEETGEHGGKGFHVYLEGIDNLAEVDKMTPEEQKVKLSPADFWGLRMMQICTGLMVESGVVKEIKPRSK